MKPENLFDYLKGNAYPGRGILLGLAPDGQRALVAYFIMGRSENSRNRVFTEKDGGIVTEAADPAKLQDPSLVIYAPVRPSGEHTIVTNGDQTDTIYDFLQRGESFEAALRTRTFEPDGPLYTPRISGLLSLGMGGFSYRLSILKSAGGDPDSAQRFFFEYAQPQAGVGHLIHTYAGDGNPPASFAGEPVDVAVDADTAAFGDGLWSALNAENKVSLFVRTLALNGESETRIYNRFSKI